MSYRILPSISFVAFLYWICIGLIAIAFVAGGDGSVGAGKNGVSLAWYIIFMVAGVASASWLVILHMAPLNKRYKLDCAYRTVALSMAVPSVIVCGLSVVGSISQRFGDQTLLSVLASFWTIPLILWPSWVIYALQTKDNRPDCVFAL